MKPDLTPVVKPTLEEIQEQFIAWRSSRSRREPIPDALWEAAVSLAEEYSIGQISRVLSLSHSDLKRRVQARGDNGYQEEDAREEEAREEEALEEEGGSYRFVEFALNKPGADKPLTGESECVVEMEDHKGGKLRVHMKGAVGFNLLEVAQAFWKREP